jgi:hypothetical protein
MSLPLSKAFFSEEKKQKTSLRWPPLWGRLALQRAKVFWFFFSKKNTLLHP